MPTIWTTTAVVSIGGVLLLRERATPEFTLRQRSFAASLVFVLALAAIIERYVLADNPLMGGLYRQATAWDAAHSWSHYRSTTTLGHPEVNGAIFAAGSSLILAQIMLASKGSASRTQWFQWVVFWVAVVATGTRGSLIAGAAGNIVAYLSVSRKGYSLRSFGVALALVTATSVGVLSLASRSSSGEASTSYAYRTQTIPDTVLSSWGTGVFGVGPSLAQKWRTRIGFPPERALESAWAEAAVSLGAIGMVLMLLSLGAIVARGLERPKSAPEAAALVTLLVAFSVFNALDRNPGMLVVVSLLGWGIRGISQTDESTTAPS
jgi:hypothetical protein